MSILDPEILIKSVAGYISKDSDSQALTILEDITDTVNFLNEQKALSADTEKQIASAVAECDKQWRERYISRFGEGSVKEEEKETETDPEIIRAESITTDDLFK